MNCLYARSNIILVFIFWGVQQNKHQNKNN